MILKNNKAHFSELFLVMASYWTGNDLLSESMIIQSTDWTVVMYLFWRRTLMQGCAPRCLRLKKQRVARNFVTFTIRVKMCSCLISSTAMPKEYDFLKFEIMRQWFAVYSAWPSYQRIFIYLRIYSSDIIFHRRSLDFFYINPVFIGVMTQRQSFCAEYHHILYFKY